MRRPFIIILSILFLLGIVLESSPVASAADPVPPATSIDFPFDSTKTFDDPTADKPQSKLWYNDGSWWGVLNEKHSVRNPNNTWHIFKLAWPSSWNDTGVVVDDRPSSRADALWDNTTKKLYIGSTKSNVNGSDTSNQGRLYRYSYANGAYTLDAGFPAVMFIGSVKSTTIDKDTTGQIWVTYTKGSKVYVNRSLEDGAGVPHDESWNPAAEFIVPNTTPNSNFPTPTNLATDDISSLIAYKGNIGVLWSNHNSPSSMYFAYHKDTDADLTWQPIEQIYTATCAADDHINLKSIQADAQGRVFAAVKTSFGDTNCGGTKSSPLLRLIVRKAANSWSVATFGTVGDDHTRPVLLLDTSNNRAYMFATSPTSGCGKIYMKSADMDNPVFVTGKGTVFIDSANANGASCVNNATSTKQTVNAASGLVVLASDHSKFVYAHNVLDLGGTPATATPTSTSIATNTPTSAATATATATPVPGSTATATNTPTAGGTRLKDITFEGGSLTDPATGADATVGTVTLNATTALKGSYAATINTTSGYLREDFTAADELFVSFYFKAASFPASARLAQISNGSTTVGTIFVTTGGTLQLKNGSTTIGSASPALTAGTVYRVGLHQKKGAGANAVLEAYLAIGDAAFTAPFAASATQTITTQATRFSLGATNSAAVNAIVDTIQLDTAAFASSGAPVPTATATNTPTSAPATAVATNTPTNAPTDTPAATNTPTDTPAITNTPTDTPAATNTPTALPANTPTSTPTTAPSGGTRIKDSTFEGGSLTDPASGADAVVGTVGLETAAPLKGSYAATINTTSGYLREDFTAADELFVSFYVRVNTRNSTSARLAQISSGSTTVGNIFLTTTGALQLKNNGTTIGTSAQTLALGTLYRVGLHQKIGTGSNAVLEVYLASGDAAFGAPILTNAAQSFTTQATRFSLGATNSNALNVTVDDIRLDTAAMP